MTSGRSGEVEDARGVPYTRLVASGERRTLNWDSILLDATAFGFAFTAVAGLGFSSGGFFPATLGWAAVLALAFTAVAGTIAGWPAPTKESMVFLGAVAGLVAWTALSLLWSVSRTSTAHEEIGRAHV